MSRVVQERRQMGNVTYQLELVKCGKPGCKTCPHGPYWYAYWWVTGRSYRGRTKSMYVGKVLPGSIPATPERPR
jgi:hypothetical protein